MPKGMFTQGVCVLLDRPTSLDALESVLGDFDIRGRHDSFETWEFTGPSLIIPYRLEVNGLVSIDLVDQTWPDHMGDPKNEEMIFAAWTMGHFGPFAYPGCLERAAQQCWSWEPGKTMPDKHKAFVRVRSSYAFEADDDDLVIPRDYEPLPELEFVTKIAAAALDLPSALCYFNPNGEILRGQDGLRTSLNNAWSNGFAPIDIWSNVRLFNFNPEWAVMDTVGNGQLDIPDMEACFRSDSYDFAEVDSFVRNVSLYLNKQGELINDGDTMDGPGDIVWQAKSHKNGICDPPRRVLRWFPVDGHTAPPELIDVENIA